MQPADYLNKKIKYQLDFINSDNSLLQNSDWLVYNPETTIELKTNKQSS